MDHYNKYALEDFVLDAKFQEWAKNPTNENSQIWEEYIALNPSQANEIRDARYLLSSVYSRFQAHISDEEIEGEIEALVSQIRLGQPEKTAATPSHFLNSRLLVRLVAASVLLAMAWATWFLLNRDSGQKLYTSLDNGKMTVTENTSENARTILLEDGTEITLEPGSKLQTPETFQKDKREVFLTGEAFFKVKKDAKRPFLVYSDKLTTRVLGTSFRIKAIKNSDKEVVEVREGKVSVFKNEDFDDSGMSRESQGILLTANQKVTLVVNENQMVKTLSDLPEVVPGKSEILKSNYVNAPVTRVLKDLHEAYQIDVVFDEELLSDCPLTVAFTDQSLQEKLAIICEAIEAKYEILDGHVMIYGKNCKE